MATTDPQKSGPKAAGQAEDKVDARLSADKTADPNKAARADFESAEPGGRTGDASVSPAVTNVAANVTVTEGASAPFSTKPGDVPVDPRTGQPFGDHGAHEGLKGLHGMEVLEPGTLVAGVDPDNIPAEVTPGVTPDAGGDKLLAAAQAKAPSLTKEFVEKMGINDYQLAQIARGEIPPPPTPGPIYTTDMYLTPGGYQQTPPGVKPEDVGGNAISR
jgi:hypothetical protein